MCVCRFLAAAIGELVNVLFACFVRYKHAYVRFCSCYSPASYT
jgi:hypothetical protein